MPTMYSYTGSGGATLTGDCECFLFISQEFSWNILSNITVSQDFSWNVGDAPLMWYQIQGQCIPPTCNNSLMFCDDSNSCQGQNRYYMAVIAARSVADVCNQLANRNVSWPIQSIKVHTVPASPSQIAADAANGITNTQDQLISVPFCQIPDCFEFCLAATGIVGGTMDMTGIVVNVFSYTGSGGFYLTDSGVGNLLSVHYVGSGGATLGGSGIIASSAFMYIGSGGATLGGDGIYGSSYGNTYTGSGGATLGGEANASIINWPYFGDIPPVAGTGDFSISDVSIDFGTSLATPSITPPSNLITTSCDCQALPVVLTLMHNFNTTNKLSNFLQNNNLTLPTTLNMSYDAINDLWRSTLHYLGNGASGGIDTWIIMFTWGCTSSIGSYDLGESVWVFSLFISQRNTNASHAFDTRASLSFSDVNMCSAPTFDFSFQLNTQTNIMQTDPVVTLYSQILYDDIGLFGGVTWLSNPLLSIEISAASSLNTGQSFNLTPYLQEVNILP